MTTTTTATTATTTKTTTRQNDEDAETEDRLTQRSIEYGGHKVTQ